MNPQVIRNLELVAGAAFFGGLLGGAIGYLKARSSFAQQLEDTKANLEHSQAMLGKTSETLREVRYELERLTLAQEKVSTENARIITGATSLAREAFTDYSRAFNPQTEPEEPQKKASKKVVIPPKESDEGVIDREDPRHPHVITCEEFAEDNPEYEKITLAYFEEDDVLADDDGMIDNTEYIVGSVALRRFGVGSRDPNIVYVRNPAISADFEIVKSHKSYVETILGVPPEPRDKRPRKMRASDD